MAHDFGMLWKQKGFLTSSGQATKNRKKVVELLDTILLPSAIAIIKVSGRSKADTTETKENSLADHTAKAAVTQIISDQLTTAFPFQPPSNLN